jgi:hypothetical protein
LTRRLTSVARSQRSWSRAEARIRRARQQPAAVVVTFRCPICGQAHDRLSHDAPGCHGLTDTELHALRISAVDELVNAVRHDAPQDHIKGVVAVLDVVDARLGINA